VFKNLKNMKKVIVLIAFVNLFGDPSVSAQNTATEAPKVVSTKAHKIVFQLTSSDTLVHKALLKQVLNALNAAPNAKIEVVCHNNGIEMLTIAKTTQAKKMAELKAKGVVFAACENTLSDRKIDKKDVVSEAIFVPSGIIEIVIKQEDGWSYFKAGF
jgi:uncharacterized protein